MFSLIPPAAGAQSNTLAHHKKRSHRLSTSHSAICFRDSTKICFQLFRLLLHHAAPSFTNENTLTVRARRTLRSKRQIQIASSRFPADRRYGVVS